MLGPASTTGDPSNRRQTARSLAAVAAALVALCVLVALGGVGADASNAEPAGGSPAVSERVTGLNATALADARLQPSATCRLSDEEAPPGSDVTLIASDSSNGDSYRYDKDGDGTYETDLLTQETFTFTYEEPGTYTPTVWVRESSTEETDTAPCGTLVIDENEDPNPQLSYSPSNPGVGETVTLDPAGTSDPDGDDIRLLEYDTDGDGTYERVRETFDTVSTSYDSPGQRTVTLRVQDEHGATATTSVTFTVGQEVVARCSVSPESVTVGEQVTVDASASENAETASFNVDNDGTYEYTDQPDFETVHSYEEPGTYEVTARVRNGERTDEAFCGTVTVTDNQPPAAELSVDPQNTRVGQAVTFDASGSFDQDGRIRAYWWDFDGDNTVDLRTNASQTSYQYQSSGSYVARVTVVDDDGARDTAERDVIVEGGIPTPTTLCTIEETTITVGESTTVDASGSDGANTVEFDTDGDGTYERSDSEDFVIQVSYDSAGEYDVVARGTNEGGFDIEECGTITVRDPGTDVPVTDPPRTFTDEPRTSVPGEEFRSPTDEPGGGEVTPTEPGDEGTPADEGEDPGGPLPEMPDWLPPALAGLLGITGLGGAAYYLYPGGGGGGGGGTSAPPKPPSTPPSSAAAQFETGTFLTPPESGPVTVTGLGFRPDLVTFAVTTNVRSSEAGSVDRSDGWSHGRAIRGTEGDIPQTVVALTDDTRNVDSAMGASSDGHALEIGVHEDAPPERVTGQVTAMTDDGFEMTFDVEGLRGDRLGDQYVVHYEAFAFGKGNRVEVGHFRTPEFPGSQSVPLSIDADHVVLTATNTLGTVDDRRMTDLPIGFSHGEVVGRNSPGQLVRNATVAPAGAGGTAAAAFEGRALHLLYADDEEIRGRTTARVTSLGDSLDLEYDKVYNGPAKLGSVEPKLVTYVAVETNDLQPTIGYFQLPADDDILHVDLGFEPRLIEFTTVGVEGIDTETFSRASPLGFGWSHGSVLAGREEMDGVRQYVVNDATEPDRSTYEPHEGSRHDGVAASVRSLADGGRIVGREDLTVTGVTDTGFRVAVTGLGTGDRDDASRPLVFYKAWPNPDTGSATESAGAGRERRRQEGRTARDEPSGGQGRKGDRDGQGQNRTN